MAKHKPPSRIRYEQQYPALTIRLTRQIRETIDRMAKETGQSYGSLVRAALEGSAKSYETGYNNAKDKYRISYPCAVCRGEIEVQRGSQSYQAVLEHLKEGGWGHSRCNKTVNGGETK